MFLPDVFYDACDQLGLLVYHDMQYAQEGHSPVAGKQQDAELRYQVRRLSTHPSIAVWDGCNEHVSSGSHPRLALPYFILPHLTLPYLCGFGLSVCLS